MTFTLPDGGVGERRCEDEGRARDGGRCDGGECTGGPDTGTEYEADCRGEGRGSRLSGDMIIARDGERDCMGRGPIEGTED